MRILLDFNYVENITKVTASNYGAGVITEDVYFIKLLIVRGDCCLQLSVSTQN